MFEREEALVLELRRARKLGIKQLTYEPHREHGLRQVKSWLVLTPWRRATPCTVAPGANVSATSWRFSSSVQRRRARP